MIGLVEMVLDILIVVAALASFLSGIWAISAFQALSYRWRDVLSGRLDVLLFVYVVLSTSISAWHAVMMAVWASQSGVVSTGAAFMIEINLWNIVQSVLMIVSHVIIHSVQKVKVRSAIQGVYMWGHEE